MISFLLRRLPVVALVLIATSVIAFALPRLVPGDAAAAVAGPEANAEQVAAIRAELGLDEPLVQQYFQWIGGLFTGDLGTSFAFRRPVAELIVARLESTLELAVGALILLTLIGLALGVLGGSARSSGVRRVVDGVNTLSLAMPSFLLGLLLIVVFGITFRLLPASGEVAVLDDPVIGLQYLLMPALALALAGAAHVARLVQTSMLSVRQEEFVDLAVAKGSSPRRITYRHVLRNSLGPGVVAIGIRFGDLLAGAVVIEAIFARNGLGLLAVTSAQSNDYPVIQVLIVGAVFIAVVVQLLTEIGLAALDPRVRLR